MAKSVAEQERPNYPGRIIGSDAFLVLSAGIPKYGIEMLKQGVIRQRCLTLIGNVLLPLRINDLRLFSRKSSPIELDSSEESET